MVIEQLQNQRNDMYLIAIEKRVYEPLPTHLLDSLILNYSVACHLLQEDEFLVTVPIFM